METSSPTPTKKGLGPLAWVGIGCGGIAVFVIIEVVTFSMVIDWKIKKVVEDFQTKSGQTTAGWQPDEFSKDAQKNPTRVAATTMVKVSGGQFEMVAEDDANKRYTVKEKKSGKLTTIYWSEKTKAPVFVEGDFSAIPAEKAGRRPAT